MAKRPTIIIALIAVAALFAAWFVFTSMPSNKPPENLTKVTVRLKWVHQAQFAGFYVAKEKGFYRRYGIDANLEPGGPNFPAIQTVVAGNEEFGVTGADQILQARSKGADPVPLLVIYQRTPFVLFARQDSNISKMQDLVGKKVGVKLGGNEELTYRAMMSVAGVREKDVVEVPVAFDMAQFFAGQVDVWPGYAINEPLLSEEKGIKVNIIAPDSLGIEMYADTLFTTGSYIKAHPVLVRRFIEATRQGWIYALEHPEEAARITEKYAGPGTYAHQLAMLKASLPLLKPSGSQFGDMSEIGWLSTSRIVFGGSANATADIRLMLAEARAAQVAAQ